MSVSASLSQRISFHHYFLLERPELANIIRRNMWNSDFIFLIIAVVLSGRQHPFSGKAKPKNVTVNFVLRKGTTQLSWGGKSGVPLETIFGVTKGIKTEVSAQKFLYDSAAMFCSPQLDCTVRDCALVLSTGLSNCTVLHDEFLLMTDHEFIPNATKVHYRKIGLNCITVSAS